MYYNLSKSQKKIARRVIDKGLRNHYLRALSEAKNILAKPPADNFDAIRDKYLKLYNCLRDHDKNIGRIYNDKGGSRWVQLITIQFAEGVIDEEDLQDFDQELQDRIITMGKSWRS